MLQRLNVVVVEVEEKTSPKTGKGYKVANVSYRKDSDSKMQSKMVMSFGKTEKAFLSLVSNGKGSYDVEMEKNDAGYWDWLTAVPATGEAPKAPVQSSGGGSATFTDKQAPAKGNWETTEERAVKQRYIVRQSSLSNAIEYLNVTGNKKASIDDVIDVASKLENFVFEGPAASLTSQPQSTDTDDINY